MYLICTEAHQGTYNSFYYQECHLRQEKTLIIEPMAPIKGIEIELEAKVTTLWLVNCHPLRLSCKPSPQELEASQPSPRTVNKPSNQCLETLGHMSSLRTPPLPPILCMKSRKAQAPHRDCSYRFVLCVCCCHRHDPL